MSCLALEPDSRTSSAALAARTKVPPDYLAKVLQQLSTAGLIEGRRGVGGGYRLLTKPDKTTLLDVVNAVEPLRRITSCPLGLESHGTALCSLHSRIDNAIAGVIATLENSTLEDLLVNGPQSELRNIPLCESHERVALTIRSKQQ